MIAKSTGQSQEFRVDDPRENFDPNPFRTRHSRFFSTIDRKKTAEMRRKMQDGEAEMEEENTYSEYYMTESAGHVPEAADSRDRRQKTA